MDHFFTEYLRANKHETALSFFLLEFNPTDLYNAGFQKYLPRLRIKQNFRARHRQGSKFQPGPKEF